METKIEQAKPESINLSKTITLRVLSPLHIGDSSEKLMIKGIDFFYHDNTIYVVDEQKLFTALQTKNVNFNDYANLVAKGNSEDLQDYLFNQLKINPKEISKRSFENTKTPNREIRPFIRTGLNIPYIAGSSLKGAIRSIIFHTLNNSVEKKRFDERKKEFIKVTDWELEKFLLGGFEDSITKFIKVYDANLQDTDLQISCIELFNLYNRLGTWESDYKKGFEIFLETAKPETIANFRLSIAKPLIDVLKQNPKVKLQANLDKIIAANPFAHLFQLINAYTNEHLRKEIEFFEKYSEVENFSSIIEQLRYFQTLTQQGNETCVIRLSYGSGFHGITGDWQYASHIEVGAFGNGKLKYKSRKVIGDDLMGFVQLSTIGEFPKVERKISIVEKTVTPQIQTIFTKGMELQAEFVKLQNPFPLVKLLNEGNNSLTSLTNAKTQNFKVGDKMLVKVSKVKDNSVKEVEFISLIKK
jgi:CRISPR type III-A-associated RAMP protein Csm5